MDNWYTQPLHRRAPSGGCVDPLNDRFYLGGELLPFYVPRPIMPQIDESDFPLFFAFMRDRGIPYAETVLPTRLLRAHQRVDRFHAEQMPDDVLAKPVMVSQDEFVLDGNHRWLAHVRRGLEAINAIQIAQPFEDAIATMFAFPGCYSLAHHVQGN